MRKANGYLATWRNKLHSLISCDAKCKMSTVNTATVTSVEWEGLVKKCVLAGVSVTVELKDESSRES